MPCTSRYASAADYATMMCLPQPLDAGDQAVIETFLDLASGDIHIARQAQDGCSCTETAGALMFLRVLNVRIAAVLNRCPCGRGNLSEGEQRMWLEWAQAQLDAIRSGKLELCQGATGAEFPYVTWAEHNLTEWAAVEIMLHRELRYP